MSTSRSARCALCGRTAGLARRRPEAGALARRHPLARNGSASILPEMSPDLAEAAGGAYSGNERIVSGAA
jgi:hypothetical protein